MQDSVFRFSRGLSVCVCISRILRRAVPPGVACPPAAIPPGYCCTDLSVIGRSCGCLCDSGSTWRFVGSDVGGGGGFIAAACGRGSGGCAGWIAAGGAALTDSCGTGAAIAGVDGFAGGAGFLMCWGKGAQQTLARSGRWGVGILKG